LKKHFWILIVIFSIQFASGQSVAETYQSGIAFFNQGDFELAAQQFRRVVFFSDSTSGRALFYLGDCYRQLELFVPAVYYYRLAGNTILNDSLSQEIKFRIAVCHLKNHQASYALTELFSVGDSMLPEQQTKLYFYLFCSYYLLHDYSSASDYYLMALGETNNSKLTSIDSLFRAGEKNQAANVYLPMYLSIIPGLGQLYLGEWKEALNSFIITAAFASVFVFTAYQLALLDAALMVLPWFHRYYQGGLMRAKELAVIKKNSQDVQIYNQLLDFYSNNSHTATGSTGN